MGKYLHGTTCIYCIYVYVCMYVNRNVDDLWNVDNDVSLSIMSYELWH